MRFAVCDDEAELRRDISDRITALCPGASVTEFSTGSELLAGAGNFDIIFLDIGMDGLDGMQTAKKLRQDGCRAAIIFVTAFEDRVFDAFDVGAFRPVLLSPTRRMSTNTAIQTSCACLPAIPTKSCLSRR